MSEAEHSGPSWKRIIGFACHQGCIFSLFYMGANRGLEIGGTVFERVDLFLTLAFMCLTFAVGRRAIAHSLRSRSSLVAILISAALLAAGTLASGSPIAAQPLGLALEGALLGCPLAVLFMAWGTVLGSGSPRAIACEVFAATGFASAICFACAFLPPMVAHLVPAACAIAGAAVVATCLFRPKHADGQEETREKRAAGSVVMRDDASASGKSPSPAMPRASLSTTFKRAGMGPMSMRMIGGAATYGVAAGFMETYRSDPGMLSTPDFPATLLILALFCIAVLQSLFVEKPTEGESLGSMYRIAMLVIMAGFLFSPLLEGSGVPGEAIILAGYLGLAAAFMSFFLVMARVSNTPAPLAFAGGLTALYAGETCGIAAANVYDVLMPGSRLSYGIMACAGLAILFAYLFLFTERDFRALSAIVDTSNALDAACERMAERFKLSARETEVLGLALRGRSNERIAQELFVAKSTADTHMRRIYGKCGVKGRQELIDLGERTVSELQGPKAR